MSIQSAITFGLILGVTLFLVYLSIIAHRDQGNIKHHDPPTSFDLLASPKTSEITENTNLRPSTTESLAQSPTSSTNSATTADNHDVKIVSLSKAELSLLKKDHGVVSSSSQTTTYPLPTTKAIKGGKQTVEDEREDKKKSEILQKIKKEKLSRFNELAPEQACLRMKKKFHVVPNISWGTLPTELQQ